MANRSIGLNKHQAESICAEINRRHSGLEAYVCDQQQLNFNKQHTDLEFVFECIVIVRKRRMPEKKAAVQRNDCGHPKSNNCGGISKGCGEKVRRDRP